MGAGRRFSFRTRLGSRLEISLVSLDFTEIQVENRSDFGQYQTYATPAHGPLMANQGAGRGRARG